ncbi:hypothetical protein, partial [Streptomyces anulatus]|uniref:hypothetical protein n=1 Tax=Streptomyces anulatus TaxID=1892 RepID=UPI002F918CAD
CPIEFPFGEFRRNPPFGVFGVVYVKPLSGLLVGRFLLPFGNLGWWFLTPFQAFKDFGGWVVFDGVLGVGCPPLADWVRLGVCPCRGGRGWGVSLWWRG